MTIKIAHRGASGYLPEHTLQAASYAHALGADYIEQDVVLSKDSVPVVLHDIYLNSDLNFLMFITFSFITFIIIIILTIMSK